MINLSTLYVLGLMLIFTDCEFSTNRQRNEDGGTASSGNRQPEAGNYKTVEAFPGLEFEQPLELTSPDDGRDRVFVVAQQGVIHVFPNKPDAKKAAVFLDIEKKVESGG